MSNDDREAEDVAGLFRKFGGNSKGYREFEPAPEVGRAQAAWTLIPGSTGAAAPQAAPAAPVAAAAAPLAAIPEPVAAAPAPRPLPPPPAPTAVTASPSGAPRDLDLLFARLAGRPQPSSSESAHGLMSRWRKPS